jgi:hypothetical protein
VVFLWSSAITERDWDNILFRWLLGFTKGSRAENKYFDQLLEIHESHYQPVK